MGRTLNTMDVRDAVTLRRTVRLCVNPGDGSDTVPRGPNGYAGTPPMRGLGRFYAFNVIAVGTPDPDSGYLVDIKTIDRAVRSAIYPRLVEACHDTPETDPVGLLVDWADPLAAALRPHTLRAVRWELTPTYSVGLEGLDMTDTAPRRVLIRQRFDFAAAHRLHAEGLSDEDNRTLFGKCNNPSGHGHNYQVEPCVAVEPGQGFSLARLEALTDEIVVDHFDHRHLNVDTEEFGPGGSNPSVENIARVGFERLAPAIAEAGAELVSMTVWETDRTSCTYPA